MGEEQAPAGIERTDFCHIVIGKFKIENIKVLHHAVFVYGFGYNNHAALNQKAQGNLCCRFIVLCGNFV